MFTTLIIRVTENAFTPPFLEGPRGLTESVPVGYLSFCMRIVFPGSAINGHARENLLIWIIVEIEQETAVTSHQYAIDKSTLVTISVVVSGNHEYRRS